jgi:YD repeat-containing protein
MGPLVSPTTAWAQSGDAGLEETGVKLSRAYLSLMPWERIDTYAGGLVLTFTDLVLPGNAGFDLRFGRSYNSKGPVHWRIGPGLMRQADEINSPVPQGNPVIITADGSEERSFETDRTGVYRTLSYAEYDRGTQELRQPNGIIVTYGCYWSPAYENTRYPTEAEDAFGNTLTFVYDACVPEQAQRPLLQTITQDLGNGQSRTVQFTHLDGRIHTMTYAGRTWTYNWNGDLLVSVQPPAGGAWVFGYTNSRVSSVTTPNGGVVEYTYLWDHVVVPGRHPTVVVSTRRSTGRAVPEGLWQFTYRGDSTDLEIHADSSNLTRITSTLKYFFGDDYPYGGDWGAVREIETWEGSALLQTDHYQWRAGAPVGLADPVSWDVDPFSPLPASRSITRGSRTWTTTYTYRESDFNDYGQPATLTEVGELTRTRTFSYTHAFTRYVRGKTTGMTVSVAGESFTIAQAYDSATGFMTSRTVYGIPTTLAHDGLGNVASETDAHGHETTFAYSWGTVNRIATEEYAITRGINPDGTLASETRRGLTTSYQYDDLGRETRHTPPLGDPTVTAYFSGSYTVSRGGYQVTTRLDGVGRSTGTSDSLGVNTQIACDALGRRIYESYPYTGSVHRGTTYTYDALDRVARTDQPDPDDPDTATVAVTRVYTGNTVAITDEEERVTVQTWAAFGSPESARLTSVRDAHQKTTSYTYNALGKLTSVSPGGRSWVYNSQNLLGTEAQPESGPVTYLYVGGLLTSRADDNGVTTYGYDRNDRLTTATRPGFGLRRHL